MHLHGLRLEVSFGKVSYLMRIVRFAAEDVDIGIIGEVRKMT
jgi:hypothetical protein